LNYAYSALEGEIRIKAISEGYDPTIGLMREGSDGSSKFIFDLMEPERPKVDRAVLDFVKGHVLDPADFVIRTDGVRRLNPEMARMVVAKVSAWKIFDADRPESTLTGHSFWGMAAVRPDNVAGPDVAHSSGNPALRTPSIAFGTFGECAINHLTVRLGLSRRASAKADLASSMLPSRA
jgi:hypothetical protein